MRGLGAALADLISIASLGSSFNLLVLGQS